MPDKLILQIEITSSDEKERKREYQYDLPDGGTADSAFNWFTEYMDNEARVEIILNDFKTRLPDPKSLDMETIKITVPLQVDMTPYFDIKNRVIAWLELYNLLLSAREHLAQSRAYKEVEPAYSGKPGRENDLAYKMHLRKMDEFHHAVRDTKKIEDTILRLIYEALSTSLSGIKKLDNGEPYLTFANVTKGLKNRESNERLRNVPDSEYNELMSIIDAMSTEQGGMASFRNYRNALEHREPESVDYPEQFAAYEQRTQPGQAVGFIGSMPTNAKWRFEDLYDTAVAVYQHYLDLLERLDKLPTFRRPV
jgi:hypothetical protein